MGHATPGGERRVGEFFEEKLSYSPCCRCLNACYYIDILERLIVREPAWCSDPLIVMMEEDDEPTQSRVERSLRIGYWYFPLEPTSEEICAALRTRDTEHYEDGYPDNLVSLNRFFVMHKVGYRNGKGVKLEGWKTYDDHLMTKTSSGPLNGNDNLVLRIFAMRPVVKGVEPVKLCWVKELSKGHQSGRRKKNQPLHKRLKIQPFPKSARNPTTSPEKFALTSHYPSTNALILYQHDNNTSTSQELHPPPLSTPKHNNIPQLPGLHVTLAELAESLAPIHLPPLDSSSAPLPHLKYESKSDSNTHALPSPLDTSSPQLSNSSYLSPSLSRSHISIPSPSSSSSSASERSLFSPSTPPFNLPSILAPLSPAASSGSHAIHSNSIPNSNHSLYSTFYNQR